MSNNYGPGVSRVLSPTGTQFTNVIFQQGRPPLDAEFTLLQDIAQDACRQITLRGTPSGWLGNETNLPSDFQTSADWSNWFKFGRQRTGEQQAVMWAAVNGWLIPVTGTKTGTPPGSPNDTDTWNKVTLDPPPANSGDTRIDFVFLEAWLARVPPNPSTLNKPSASAIYRYGNVEGGMTFIADDITDPAIGEETTQRVQVQYRIRVVKGLVGFTSYPDGFDPAVVKAQGAVVAPTAYTFTNMRQTLGDPGLWRAGDGSGTAQTALGTVDGYVYAIPICAVFRRNGVSWMGDPAPNLNGGFSRNPLAVDRTGATTFTAVGTLAANLTDVGLVATLVATAGLPLPLNPATPVLIQIGDELIRYSVIAGVTMTLTERGANGSRAEAHKAGATIRVLSGRPDGLFADQIAKTDILDLRHAINPNGFDYTALLKSNLDKLLKGQLRANWKRTGAAGPQGPFCFYQDKIVNLGGGVALGVTRLDGPDNIRMTWSDAAVPQAIELVVAPVGAPGSANVAWALDLTVNATVVNAPNFFSPTDELEVPIAQFKAGLPGGDADQVRFLNDGLTNVVTIRIDGQTDPLLSNLYTVTPANPTSSDNLKITLGADFPVLDDTRQLYITVHVMYGPGRGVARRPDALHSASFLNPSPDMLVRPTGTPSQYLPMHIRASTMNALIRQWDFYGAFPAAAECCADLGSKTVTLTPFRRMPMPATIRAMDGTAANPRTGAAITSSNQGVANGTVTFVDATKDFGALSVIAGDVLIISDGYAPGHYTVAANAGGGDNFLTLTQPVWAGVAPPAAGLSYEVRHAQGLMPLLKADGVTPKWTMGTDPLELFSGTTDPDATRKDIYVTLPRHLVPGWGEYHVPILWTDTVPYSEGINFMSLSVKGAGPFADKDQNYVSYTSGIDTFSTFSTIDLNNPYPPAGYNTAFLLGAKSIAGMRKFTDTKKLGSVRQGLELPPFYGIARLFAVYEATDYRVNGSSYSTVDRGFLAGKATNLLRQNVDGPTFWIEIDDDGDATFVLNADCIDISKSPNPIASFATGDYVIEANVFGFDRGSFDLDKVFRLVLNRQRAANQANSGNRVTNLDPAQPDNNIAGPVVILPGPLTGSDAVVLNYSRTPYQGDAWGSQTNYIDIPQAVGPLTSGVAYQLKSTKIDPFNLTRPNQKPLEVLATVAFSTTMGTGRTSGGARTSPSYDIRTPGYEDPTVYPPSSPVEARPRILPDAFTNDVNPPGSGQTAVGTSLLGCTERLPLGALLRDKDFRGGSLTSPSMGPFRYNGNSYEGFMSCYGVSTPLEQTTAPTETASFATGAPGEVIVHVDGEQGNYGLLVNYRTYRGGSAFAASGRYPGGEIYRVSDVIQSPAGYTNVLNCMAMLVRNAVTNVGATEVSAGDELMMLIVTHAARLTNTNPSESLVVIGTNGSAEGLSAADLYRIEGHPLVNNNVRLNIDPNSIPLTQSAWWLW